MPTPYIRRAPVHLAAHSAVDLVSKTRSGKPYGLLLVSIDINTLAASAQRSHEDYLSGDVIDVDDPVVHEGPVEDIQEATECGVTDASDIDIPSSNNRDKRRSKIMRRKQRERTSERLATRLLRVIKQFTKKKLTRAIPAYAEYEIPEDLSDPACSACAAKTAFVGRRQDTSQLERVPLTKAAALAHGLEEVEWDGRTCVPIVDAKGRIIALLAGRPADDASWNKVNQEAQCAFETARRQYRFKDSQVDHRRGTYAAITSGISYGGGQTRISNLADSAHNHRVIRDILLRNAAVRRLVGFADSVFMTAAPRMYLSYALTLEAILENDKSLEANFDHSVFAGVTFNLGPQVSTFVHTDHLNLPAGWCAVIALGEFDPAQGGHLILWDLNKMIRFPAGSLILLPSAILRHSNTVVRDHERRYSLTQYSAGGLFRWVECGFRSQKAFQAQGGTFPITPQERWQQGLDNFSTMDEWMCA